MSLTRVRAIIWKESIDLKNNLPMVMLLLMPVLLAYMYRKMDSDGSMLSMALIMTIVMISIPLQSTTIAEEKEKQTLRNLMLSPASSVDILLGKSILIFLITVAVCIINLIIFNIPLSNILFFLLPIIPTIILFVAVGTIIGLASKNIAQSNVIGTPITLLMFIGPMLGLILQIDWITTITNYFPTYHLQEIIIHIGKNNAIGMYQSNLFWLFGWIVGALLLTIYFYRKGMLDNN